MNDNTIYTNISMFAPSAPSVANQLLNDTDFMSLLESHFDVDINTQYNMCEFCNLPMNCSSECMYQCESCGLLKTLIGGVQDCNQESTSTIRINSGGSSNYYNMCTDYTKIQKKYILEQLNANNQAYTKPKIPHDVLVKAAEGYNGVQQLVIDKLDGKKFVKRGGVKNETLGAWIFFECIRAGVTRKKKDIAEFMRLPNGSMSRGIGILHTLHADGFIDIPVNKEPTDSLISRYLDTLNIADDNYVDFITSLIEASIKKRVGMSSITSSKIVGAIYILVQKQKLSITIADIENACDNTRKNTFMRFAKEIDANMLKFINVFESHGIKHGLEGKIRRRSVK